MPSRLILITGFEPFARMDRNPSTAVVDAMRMKFHAGDIVSEVLPVEYRKAQVRLDQLIEQHQPAAWLGFGLNQRATAIMLERVAVNLDDASLADNGGEVRRGQPIDPAGPEHYRSTLPLDAMAAELAKLQIPTNYSDSAGRFVCNHVFYHALGVLRRANPAAIGGFVHIPWPSDWEEMPSTGHSVSLVTMIRAGQACAETILHELRRQKIVAT